MRSSSIKADNMKADKSVTSATKKQSEQLLKPLDGKELKQNNEEIVKLINQLRQQRQEIDYLIQRQEVEKQKVETEIEMLTFKLTLLCKSLNQRIIARSGYDKTIAEILERYYKLVEASGKLLVTVTKEAQVLEEIMDKSVGTNKGELDADRDTTEGESDSSVSKDNPQPPTPAKRSKLSKEDVIIQSVNIVSSNKSKSDIYPVVTHHVNIDSELDKKPQNLPKTTSEISPAITETSSDYSEDDRLTLEYIKLKGSTVDPSITLYGEAYSKQHSVDPSIVGDQIRRPPQPSNDKNSKQ